MLFYKGSFTLCVFILIATAICFHLLWATLDLVMSPLHSVNTSIESSTTNPFAVIRRIAIVIRKINAQCEQALSTVLDSSATKAELKLGD